MKSDVEMTSNDEKNSGGGIEMMRKIMKEWGKWPPYQYQIFNKDESPNWRHPRYDDSTNNTLLSLFYDICERYQSFDFSIGPMIVGKVKHCSYSELDGITKFNKTPEVIQHTVSGRLFHGTIVEGSEERPAVVKTWDFLCPIRPDGAKCLNKFCDEIELFTDERVNTHPNLVKLYRYCIDTRLAVVFDGKFARVLSDVLLADDFGWDERMKVATQLADLFSCLHEKKIALGCVTASCIMIDEEVNIKVFDFGYVTNFVMVDISILDQPRAPEIVKGERTMKSDIFIFGVLLLELIAKKKFTFVNGPHCVERSVIDEAIRGKRYLVHECFGEVDHSTAFDITLLAFLCMDSNPDKRPAMKDVLDALKAMRSRGEKRKRDDNEAEQNKRYPTLLD